MLQNQVTFKVEIQRNDVSFARQRDMGDLEAVQLVSACLTISRFRWSNKRLMNQDAARTCLDEVLCERVMYDVTVCVTWLSTRTSPLGVLVVPRYGSHMM
jgi:hypothetical protein